MHPNRALVADVGLSVVILVLAASFGGMSGGAAVLGSLASAAAVGLARSRGFPALVLIWLAAALQVLSAGPIPVTVIAVVVTGYRLGRHGGPLTAWCAALSVPVGAGVAVVLARRYPDTLAHSGAVDSVIRLAGVGLPGLFAILIAVLGAPVAVGLLVRTNERYRISRGQRDLAEAQAASEHDIAQSRAKQTQLARDVHDVVGHSLAVIIAQADSARLAARDEEVRATLDQIAAVGRNSLAEVRDVLQRTAESPGGPESGGEAQPIPELDELVAGVRAAGHTVDDRSSGPARPLATGTAAAAYRVLQELLTNALKHGGGPIEVEREWVDRGLTLRVANPVAADTGAPVEGMGLAGVRSRLDGVGGTFRVAVTGHGTDRARFVATAFLPAR